MALLIIKSLISLTIVGKLDDTKSYFDNYAGRRDIVLYFQLLVSVSSVEYRGIL